MNLQMGRPKTGTRPRRFQRLCCEGLEARHLLTITLQLAVEAMNEAPGGELVEAILTRDGDTSEALEVALTTSDDTLLWAPQSVTFPAGQSSLSVNLETVNNFSDTPNQVVSVSATALDNANASDSLQIMDDDLPGSVTLGGRFAGEVPPGTYVVTSDLTVDLGTELVIAPKTTFRFQPNTELIVGGILLAEGEEGSDIVFTSASDPPTPGDWNGVRVIDSDGERAALERVEIGFAKIGLHVDHADVPTVTLFESIVHHSLHHGVAIQTGPGDQIGEDDVLLHKNRVHDNGEAGIYVSASTSAGSRGRRTANSPSISGNEVFNNHDYAIRVSSSYGRCCGYVSSAFAGPHVIGNSLHNNGGGIWGSSSSPVDTFGGATVGGMYANNLVVANVADGIRFTRRDSGFRQLVVNNTIVGNGGSGIATTDSPYTVRNNVIVGNTVGIGADVPLATITDSISHNNVFESREANWVNFPSEYGTVTQDNNKGVPSDFAWNISVAPQFVGVDDYHLELDSPLIDAGTMLDATEKDADGDKRFGSSDIGYDEAPALKIAFSSQAISEGGKAVGTVSRNVADISTDVDVRLLNGNPSAAVIPDTALIPSGLSSVAFEVAPINNGIVDGRRVASFVATAADHVPAASSKLAIEDDEFLPVERAGDSVVVTSQGNEHNLAVVETGYFVTWRGANGMFARFFDASGAATKDAVKLDIGAGFRTRVASDSEGRFVVVWQADDSVRRGVYARIFSAEGTPMGDVFLVTEGKKLAPDVAMNADGEFVVTWFAPEDGFHVIPSRVFAKTFDARGHPTSDEIIVDDGADGSTGAPRVSIDSDGDFVVVWPGGRNFRDIVARLFDANGHARDNSFRVATTDSLLRQPAVTMHRNGNFIVSWFTKAKLFDPMGVALSDELTSMGDNKLLQDVAFAVDESGRFTITGTGWDHHSQRVVLGQFTETGFPLTRAALVGTTTKGSLSKPAIAVTPEGDFVVAWQSNTSRISAQRFTQPQPKFTLTIDESSIAESAGQDATRVTLTRNAVNIASDLEVDLTSRDPSELSLPKSVVIQAGKTSVTFPIDAVDDRVLDGTQSVMISATAQGFETGTLEILVTDDATDLQRLPGDANEDGMVTFADFLRLSTSFGNADADWEDGDFNFDDKVTFEDFLILSENFGKQRPIAEPTAAANDSMMAQATDDFFARHEEDSTLLN